MNCISVILMEKPQAVKIFKSFKYMGKLTYTNIQITAMDKCSTMI